MLKSVIDNPETQSDALDALLGFDLPPAAWRIQRRDGRYLRTWEVSGERTWTERASEAMPFLAQSSAQHAIDIQMGTEAGRKAMRGCKPVCVVSLLEPGDHVVCACGQLHEADYCPAADGHGAAR